MADLSKIKLNGNTYNFKDALARKNITLIQEMLPHEPESDSDFEAMLSSLNLPIINDNNTVGYAMVGTATIA